MITLYSFIQLQAAVSDLERERKLPETDDYFYLRWLRGTAWLTQSPNTQYPAANFPVHNYGAELSAVILAPGPAIHYSAFQ